MKESPAVKNWNQFHVTTGYTFVRYGANGSKIVEKFQL